MTHNTETTLTASARPQAAQSGFTPENYYSPDFPEKTASDYMREYHEYCDRIDAKRPSLVESAPNMLETLEEMEAALTRMGMQENWSFRLRAKATIATAKGFTPEASR